jgi:PAS domain-containing protein
MTSASNKFLATYTARQDEELGLALGASRFIVKPVEPREFLAILEEVRREGESGNIPVPAVDLDEGGRSLSLYNERLVRKLERKMQQLEVTRTALAASIKTANREIAQRHLAEEALRENELRLVSIYNTVEDVIFRLAVEPEWHFRFVSVNAAFLRVTGLSLEVLMGETVNEVIPEPSDDGSGKVGRRSNKIPSCVGKRHRITLPGG